MDSSICVATITGLPSLRQLRTMRFWIAGHLLGRQLDAEVAARHHHRVGHVRRSRRGAPRPRAFRAWRQCRRDRRSDRVPPICLRGAARRTAQSSRARESSAEARGRAVFGSQRRNRRARTPGTFTPLRSDSLPPTATRVSAKSAPQRSTTRRSLPSSSSSSVPGFSAAKISGCGSAARWALPGCRIEIEPERLAFGQHHRPAGEGADAQLGALQVGEDADRPTGLASRAPAGLRSARVVVMACRG